VIYSKWLPDTGRYDYYDAPVRYGLGDDMPVPELPMASELGVASTEVGRPMPAGAVKVGSGNRAVGAIVPLSRAGLGSVMDGLPLIRGVAAFVLGLAAGWLTWGKRR
jgi:hypothetical protein